MDSKAKLNARFYIMIVVLAALVFFGWYFGVYFLNTNEILMEDGTPMTARTKLFFTVAESLIIGSWTLSLFTVIRQAIRGYAFELTENSISHTFLVIIPLAFIFVLPIKHIPFSAITRVTIENGITTLHLNKSKLPVCRLCRWLIPSQYQLCAGYITDQKEWVERFNELYEKNT